MAGSAEILTALRELSNLKQITREELHMLLQDGIHAALAKKHGAVLVPFFLQPLMGRPDLVQQDHIHPTVQGIEALVAETVDPIAAALS